MIQNWRKMLVVWVLHGKLLAQALHIYVATLIFTPVTLRARQATRLLAMVCPFPRYL
jgi:hypothetical protein